MLLDKIKRRSEGNEDTVTNRNGTKYKASFNNGIRVYTGDHAWKGVPPKDMTEVKKWKDNEYCWCPNHQAWVMHDPKDCTYDPKFKGRRGNQGKHKDKSGGGAAKKHRTADEEAAKEARIYRCIYYSDSE